MVVSNGILQLPSPTFPSALTGNDTYPPSDSTPPPSPSTTWNCPAFPTSTAFISPYPSISPFSPVIFSKLFPVGWKTRQYLGASLSSDMQWLPAELRGHHLLLLLHMVQHT